MTTKTKAQPLYSSSKVINGITFETRTYPPAKGQYQHRTVFLIDGVRVPGSHYDSVRSDLHFASFVPVNS